MIRRKLTRIEVTLDDTKELDELFNKSAQFGLPQASVATTAVGSGKFTNQLYQKQLSITSKQFDALPTGDSNLEIEVASTIATTNNSNNANNLSTTANNTVDSTSTVVPANLPTETVASTIANNSIPNDLQDRISYNPQPFNPPSNRFQFNQESQQLR